jgi:hypothetical protein
MSWKKKSVKQSAWTPMKLRINQLTQTEEATSPHICHSERSEESHS